jgi:hypothetical protein
VSLAQRVVVEPGDGALGPLLRVADDRLGPGESYGPHDHRAVDVVAVVLAGALVHGWGRSADLGAGDVGVLRAGSGLRHDERAGPDGARVLQCYLRPAVPGAPASHEVVPDVAGWVDLGRPDVRLWLGPEGASAPAGLVLQVDPDGIRVEAGTGPAQVTGDVAVVWQVDAARPSWAN